MYPLASCTRCAMGDCLNNLQKYEREVVALASRSFWLSTTSCSRPTKTSNSEIFSRSTSLSFLRRNAPFEACRAIPKPRGRFGRFRADGFFEATSCAGSKLTEWCDARGGYPAGESPHPQLLYYSKPASIASEKTSGISACIRALPPGTPRSRGSQSKPRVTLQPNRKAVFTRQPESFATSLPSSIRIPTLDTVQH